MSVIRKYPISENRKNEASGAVGLSLPQLARSSVFIAFIVCHLYRRSELDRGPKLFKAQRLTRKADCKAAGVRRE